MSEKLTKSDLRVLKPLGSPGQRAYGAIATELRNRLGEEYSALLAEPVASEFGNEIDWYSPISGTANKLAELETDARNKAYEKFLSMRNRVLELADELEASSSNEDMRLGEAFRNAVYVPDEENCIYLVYSTDGAEFQPVLVNWAHAFDESPTDFQPYLGRTAEKTTQNRTKNKLISKEETGSGSKTEDTTAKETKNAADKLNENGTKSKDGTISETIRRKSGTLSQFETKTTWKIFKIYESKPRGILVLCIFLVVLILAVIWLLLAPCGINFGNSFNHCPSYSNAQINAEYRREMLQNRKNLLERELTLLNNQCLSDQSSWQEQSQLEVFPEPDRNIQPEADPNTIEIEMEKNAGTDAIETDETNLGEDRDIIVIGRKRFDEIEIIENHSEQNEDDFVVLLENEEPVGTTETNSMEESGIETIEADEPDLNQEGSKNTAETSEIDTTEEGNDVVVETDENGLIQENGEETAQAGEADPTEENSDEKSETEEIDTTEKSIDVAIEEDEADGTEEYSENIIEHSDSNEEINDPEVDEEFEERLSSREATHGDLTISLLWHTKSDLDLILICPSEENISFLNKEETVESCEGFLELDANVFDSSLINEPVEHIYVNTPEQGEYKARVYMSSNRDDGSPVEFKVKIQHLGEQKTLSGSLTENDSTWDHEFKIESAE